MKILLLKNFRFTQSDEIFYANVFTSITILLYGEYMTHIWYEQKYYYTKISLTHTKNLWTKLMRITVYTS